MGLFAVTVVLLAGVHAVLGAETCQSYYNFDTSTFVSSFSCSDYCCQTGTSSTRYCCSTCCDSVSQSFGCSCSGFSTATGFSIGIPIAAIVAPVAIFTFCCIAIVGGVICCFACGAKGSKGAVRPGGRVHPSNQQHHAPPPAYGNAPPPAYGAPPTGFGAPPPAQYPPPAQQYPPPTNPAYPPPQQGFTYN